MSAIFSPCGQYRYRLERQVQLAGEVFAYFGVNPSTAGAEIEDQTTIKWRGFAVRNGASRYLAGNPFALRATDVRALASAADPVGPENDAHIADIIRDADVLVPCWGNRAKLPPALRPRLDALANILHASGKPVRVFGFTAGGDPLHPLMLGYATKLVDWRRREKTA